MPSDRAKEKKKLDMQYKLIYEAYTILKDPGKRKLYDLERKTLHNKDFVQQKNSFDDFIKLQESEISDQTKDNAKLKFIMANEEMNKKHGFKNEELKTAGLSREETSKRLSDLQSERDAQECEYIPSNKFEGKSFDIVQFNQNFNKMNKKKSKSKKNEDGTIIQWEGISAANDSGLNANEQFVPLDNNYEDLYSTGNVNSSNFASVLSDVSDNINSPSDNDNSDSDNDNDNADYVLNQNLNTDDVSKKMEEFMKTRTTELTMQENKSATDKDYWKDVMNNPYNISSQIGSVIGTDVKTIGFSKNKQISKAKLEAYKQLIYDNDK
jgi:curved DNA-binding protein CbpA